MKYLKTKIFTVLRKLFNKIYTKTNPNQNKQVFGINSLAPKIIIDETELSKVKTYLENLKAAIDAPNVNNIAITGGYGSGKSTILKTFQYHYQEYKYLNISLASFTDNKEDKENFERKIEVSILQQMFYHVKPHIIPDSRFKRIVNVSSKQLFFKILFFLLWVLAAIVLFKFEIINQLDIRKWSSSLPIDWVGFGLILIFLSGLGVYVKSVIRLFSNSKISKFNIKGEVELNEANDKSVFNQHLEEILYFFERTNYNVIIIEDVDRFGSTDIFTKLREINILINNSTLISRKICFVYAIKDEMFKISTERVKFFEFIIPIIPFINPSNASEQLKKLIHEAKLENDLKSEFTDDVVTYIDDIDMRLLINIFQEYKIYRSNLSKELSQYNLFGIIVYKNMYPSDFGELPKRKGLLYKFLSSRNNYIDVLKKDNYVAIDEINSRIQILEEENTLHIQELRAIYILKIVSLLEGFKSFYTDESVDILDAVQNDNFEKIKNQDKIQYNRFKKFSSFSGNYELSGPVESRINLKSIEKEVSEFTYEERALSIQNKKNGEIERLKKQLEKLKNEIFEFDAWGIKEIFEKISIDQYLENFTNSSLIRYLLLNGYINENYSDYISVFHGISLTYDDFTFEAKVKNGISLPYDYKLINTETILDRLHDKHFKREAVLNFILLDNLLLKAAEYPIKVHYFFEVLKEDTEKVFAFIDVYINRPNSKLAEFINLILKHKPSIWTYLLNKSNIPLERLNYYLALIFEFGELELIVKIDESESMTDYLSKLSSFIDFGSALNYKKTFFEYCDKNKVVVYYLKGESSTRNIVFDHLYKNDAYAITVNNIMYILYCLNIPLDKTEFDNSNYSYLKSKAPIDLMEYIQENISDYVNNVLLILPNTEEKEFAIIDLVNNNEILDFEKIVLLQKQVNKVSDLALIKDKKNKRISIEACVALATWENVFDYYSNNDEGVDEVLSAYLNIESNYYQLGLKKITTFVGTEEEDIRKFCVDLINTVELTISSYTALYKSIPFVYDELDCDKINVDKAKWMISNEMVSLNPETYNELKSNFIDLHIYLIATNEDKFLEDLDQYDLGDSDVDLILNSTLITIKSKLYLISKIDDSIIIGSSNTALLISNLLPKNEPFQFRFEVFEAMFSVNPSVETKIRLFNSNNEKFDDIQVKSIVEKFGEDYSRLFIKQNKPVFSNKNYNKYLFDILQRRSLIRSYRINEIKDEIKVIANY